MRDRLFESHFTTAMLSFSICLVIIFVIVYKYFLTEYVAELREEAAWMSAAVETNGTDFLLNASREMQTRITIIAPDGTVEFDNENLAENMENHAKREEVQKAFAEGEGESIRYSATLSEKTVNYAVLLANGTVMRLSRTQHSALYLFAKMMFPIVLILAVAIIASAVLAVRMADKITEPINKIDLDTPDDRDVYEELRPLVRRITMQNKQIYMQMEQLKEEHKKREIHRREFTANVSHELKTPLTSISGFAEIIRDGLVKPEDIPRFADNIYKEARRLVSLVEDIIRLSMVEDNEIKAEKSVVDIYDICCKTIDILTPVAEKQNVSFTLEGTSAKVCGVYQMLEELVYNLCDNAVKYNKPAGSVTVKIDEEPECVILTVADTGIGISDENLDRVFERFYRVDKSHSKEIGGTGLGLSIVKHSADYNNAKVAIESKLGVGTTITVRFMK